MRTTIRLSKKQPSYIIDLPLGVKYLKILSIEARPKLPGTELFNFILRFNDADQISAIINWQFNPAEFDISRLMSELNNKIQSYLGSQPNRFIQLLITAEFFKIQEGVELVVTVNV